MIGVGLDEKKYKWLKENLPVINMGLEHTDWSPYDTETLEFLEDEKNSPIPNFNRAILGFTKEIWDIWYDCGARIYRKPANWKEWVA